MRTPQLLHSSLVLLLATAACGRTDGDADAPGARDQVKAVAARTGEQLADSWLTTKIQAQYFADDDLEAREVNVSTEDGVVTLTGFVEGEPERELAVQIARNTDGVRRVDDRLTVAGAPPERGAVATTGRASKPAPSEGASKAAQAGGAPDGPAADLPQALDDAQVTARVQAKYFMDDRVKARRIDVDTRGGVVTLSGQVASDEERSRALLLARETDGVRRVEDHLTVGTTAAADPAAPPAAALDDAAVTTAIQAKYFVDPAVKSSAVNVSTSNGVVTLAGTVPTEAARRQALAIAGDTPGVVQVVDRLTVSAATPR